MNLGLKQWITSMLLAVILSLVVRTYIAEAVKVPTGSMIPTIEIHDRLLVDKMKWLQHLKHGDIVVFYPPDEADESIRYVKRLIGLPGDTIEIKEGYLYRNHEKIIENYINERMHYSYGQITVPDNSYFFLGDNRNSSNDSHLWVTPFVTKDKIVGKVMITIPTHILFR